MLVQQCTTHKLQSVTHNFAEKNGQKRLACGLLTALVFQPFDAKLKLCKTMKDKTESEKLTCSDRNNNIKLKKNFSRHRGVHSSGGSVAFSVLYGMDSSKVVLSVLASRWLILFCVWDRLSWSEFLPHLPYQTDQHDSELTLILMILFFPRPRLPLIPRLTR